MFWATSTSGWVTPWEVFHQVARNKSVRYTLVKSRGKADNIVVEVGGMLQLPKTTKGHNMIWVIIDHLTKSAHFLATNESTHMDKLAKSYIDKIASRHVVPLSTVSDQDTSFVSNF